MQKVFSSNIVSETVLVRDALLHRGIAAIIQNEHSGHSAVPEFRPPADVWITRDADYVAARGVVEDTLSILDSRTEAPPWRCGHCNLENPASFELCWNCGKDRAALAPAADQT